MSPRAGTRLASVARRVIPLGCMVLLSTALLLIQEASHLHDLLPTIWKGVVPSALTPRTENFASPLIANEGQSSFFVPTSDNSIMTDPPRAKTKSKNEANTSRPSIAACILVMDDSIRMLEWLAYHYTVLPLSHLLVVMDPNSKRVSSMVEVLDSWRSRINITVHVNDSQWMTIKDTEGFSRSIYQEKDSTKFQDWFLNKNSRNFQIQDHDRRQTQLITYCGNLMRAPENNMTWTLLTDTDEFVTFNYINPSQENASIYPYFVKRAQQRANANAQRVQNRPYRQALPPLSSRVTIAEYLKQHLVSNRTACMLIPELLVSSSEANQNHSVSSSPSKHDGNRLLTTLRNTWIEHRHGDFTKAMLDVSQIGRSGKEKFEAHMVHNIHWPSKLLCVGVGQAARSGSDYMASLLRIHHYASGTWEAFVERVGQDRRHVGNRRNVLSVDRFLRQSTAPKFHDTDLTPWVDWFIDKVGSEQAEALLFAPLARRYEEFKEVDPSIKKKLEQELHLWSSQDN